MANVDRPSGLSPVAYLNGAKYTGGGRMYCILDTEDTNVYAVGDPVVLAGDADTNGVASVTLATAGGANLVTGAIIGISAIKYGGGYFNPSNLDTSVVPATKTRNYYLLVADDPNIIFEIQEVSGGTALTSAAVGLNASLVAGTNNGYMSGWEVDNSTEAATAALQLKLLGLVQRSDNAFGEHAKWLVLLNNHSYRTGVAGA